MTNPTAAPTSKNVMVTSNPADHMVNGTGTSDDRSVINASDRQIINSERGVSGNSSMPAVTPYTGIP